MREQSRKAIVVGCGIAGPVVALALRRAGWQPEIFDAEPRPADEKGVVARFADGSSVAGDILVGCDGIYSRVRRTVFADAAPAVFTRLDGYGGFARSAGLPGPEPMMHMYFGRSAFFGHATAPDGEVYWFGNAPRASGISRPDPAEVRQHVARLHGNDPEPIGKILAATRGEIGWFPIDEMPPMAKWHRGRVVLVGDAAHAMAPHVGQGASLAMEDALMLARCLRDVDEPSAAFGLYQSLRKDRVEKISREASRSGSRKIAGPVGRLMRNLLLPVFVKLGEKASRQVFAYTIDWDERVPTDAEERRLREAA